MCMSNEFNLPSTYSAKSKSKKQVKFSIYSTLTVIPSLKNNNLWYDKDDIRRFKQEAAESLLSLRENGVTSEVEQLANHAASTKHDAEKVARIPDSARGLEHMISYPVFKLTYHSRLQVMSRVLREQERQRASGDFDESRLAEASTQNSAFAKDWASIIVSARSP
ncbi:hypothetical protein ACHAXS_000214 [Conticribra weissflogii]